MGVSLQFKGASAGTGPSTPGHIQTQAGRQH
jgi:hypothetical protein